MITKTITENVGDVYHTTEYTFNNVQELMTFESGQGEGDKIELKAPPKPVPKLEVDTEVFVWDKDGHKVCRHFSHFNGNGILHAFVDGRTSFTAFGNASPWDNWKLTE